MRIVPGRSGVWRGCRTGDPRLKRRYRLAGSEPGIASVRHLGKRSGRGMPPDLVERRWPGGRRRQISARSRPTGRSRVIGDRPAAKPGRGPDGRRPPVERVGEKRRRPIRHGEGRCCPRRSAKRIRWPDRPLPRSVRETSSQLASQTASAHAFQGTKGVPSLLMPERLPSGAVVAIGKGQPTVQGLPRARRVKGPGQSIRSAQVARCADRRPNFTHRDWTITIERSHSGLRPPINGRWPCGEDARRFGNPSQL